MRTLSLLAITFVALFTGGCVEYSFSEVQGYYSSPGNVEVTFRVVDHKTGESPDLAGINISKYIRILEDGEALSNDEGRSIEMGNAKSVNLDMLLVLDLSGSVSQSLPDLQRAAKTFINKVLTNPSVQAKIAIVAFDGSKEIQIQHDFTDNLEELVDTVNSLRPGRDPSTNLYGAIQQSYELLKQRSFEDRSQDRRFSSINKKALVVFTDGKDRAGRVSESEAINAIRHARDQFALVSAVVVGSEISLDFLETFGRKYEGYFPVGNYSALASAFDQVSVRLQRIAGSYFTARICSPKRKGIHYINLFSLNFYNEIVDDNINIEFNANGFTGGCDVKDDSQWRHGRPGHASGVLSDLEVDVYRYFFERFDHFDNNRVIFKAKADKPVAPQSGIAHFSPFSSRSKVNCNLEFVNNAGDIGRFTEFPIFRYGSFKGNYSDTLKPFHGFYLVLGQNESGPIYQLYCTPVESMIYDQKTVHGSEYDPERYVLETIDVINGDA